MKTFKVYFNVKYEFTYWFTVKGESIDISKVLESIVIVDGTEIFICDEISEIVIIEADELERSIYQY